MLKFKLGDRVKHIRHDMVGKIIEVDYDTTTSLPYFVDWEKDHKLWAKEIDLELLIKLEVEEVKKEKVKMRGLRSKVLERLNVKQICEEVYSRLEDEIVEEITLRIDEDRIADMIEKEYRDDFIDQASELAIDIILEDFDVDEVLDEIDDVVRENLS